MTIAKGFIQRKNHNYKKTFSLVSSKDSFRTIVALVSHFDLDLHQINITIMFLNGDIDETVYMVLSKKPVSEDAKNMVCKLKKSIYGLKQAFCQ